MASDLIEELYTVKLSSPGLLYAFFCRIAQGLRSSDSSALSAGPFRGGGLWLVLVGPRAWAGRYLGPFGPGGQPHLDDHVVVMIDVRNVYSFVSLD